MKCKQCNKRFQKSWKLAQHTKFEHPKLKQQKTSTINVAYEYKSTPETDKINDLEHQLKIKDKDIRRCEAVMEIIQNAIYLKNSGY